MKNFKTIILLHILLMVYSFGAVFTKTASLQKLLSFKFIFCYGMVIVIMGIYAIGWQQIIKRLPLTTAFANKAVTVVWGIIWGIIFFEEKLTIGKLAGAAIVICGVILYVKADEELTDSVKADGCKEDASEALNSVKPECAGDRLKEDCDE